MSIARVGAGTAVLSAVMDATHPGEVVWELRKVLDEVSY
jgi:hypothetical protein